MSSKQRVLVLGGKGFIGRYAVRDLVEAGAEVTVGSRQPRQDGETPECLVVIHKMLRPEDWVPVIRDFDVVLNCVGILRQRPGETYEMVHHHAPLALAEACRERGVRLVHVSAMGLRESARSRFNTSKLRGEAAIAGTGGDYVIARLSLLDGEGGFGAAWLRGVARLPVFIVPMSATGRIAALTSEDSGEALRRLCLESRDYGTRLLELGGEETFLFEEYIRGLRRRHTSQMALAIRLPGWLTRLTAHAFDVIHFSPFSFGHWEMLCHDNVPGEPHLRQVLGRAPTPVIEPLR